MLEDFFGQLDLALGGRAKRETVERGFLYRFEHRRVAMAQDHRAPRADVIDVLLAVGVPKIGAMGTLHKARCTAHSAKGAHGGVDATGDHLGGAVKEGLVEVGHVGFQCLVSLKGTSK